MIGRPSFVSLLIAVAIMYPSTAQAQTDVALLAPLVGCEYTVGGPADASRHVLFPDGDLFRPSVANSREPRNSFLVRRLQFPDGTSPNGLDSNSVNTGALSAGGVIGVWGRSTGLCRGMQLSLIGGVFAEFDLDSHSHDLINSDFVVGLQLSMRRGHLSGRARVYHQSSHLGGDFVGSHPSISDVNFGYQAIDGLVSLDGDWWRLYGGGGWVVFMNDEGTSWLVQAGAELRATRTIGPIVRPIVGVDVTRYQTYSGPTVTAVGGIEWTSPAVTRRFRALAQFSNGFVPLGQLSVDQRSRLAGIYFQIEF